MAPVDAAPMTLLVFMYWSSSPDRMTQLVERDALDVELARDSTNRPCVSIVEDDVGLDDVVPVRTAVPVHVPREDAAVGEAGTREVDVVVVVARRRRVHRCRACPTVRQ